MRNRIIIGFTVLLMSCLLLSASPFPCSAQGTDSSSGSSAPISYTETEKKSGNGITIVLCTILFAGTMAGSSILIVRSKWKHLQQTTKQNELQKPKNIS